MRLFRKKNVKEDLNTNIILYIIQITMMVVCSDSGRKNKY